LTYFVTTLTLKIHLTEIQNMKMQKIKAKGKIDERSTFRMNVLESNTLRFMSFTKQSIDKNTVVTSVVCFTGLKTEVIEEGSLMFIERDTDTICV